MNKSMRRSVAWAGMLGIVFAQIVAAAHACRLGETDALETGAALVAVDFEHASPCAMPCNGQDAEPATPVANFCEVHCTDSALPVAALDLPPIAQAPLPVVLAPLALVATNTFSSAAVDAQSCAPPRNLQFCRLLI